MSRQAVLIDGEWKTGFGGRMFQAVNPATCEALPEEYPVSDWPEIDRAIQAAVGAFQRMRGWPGHRFGAFLDCYADRIEGRTEELVGLAHQETALPIEPRLKSIELPRTTNQLRLAAAAAREGTWAMPTIDTTTNIRSMFGPIGPVVVFGPNNFPFAFNSIAGGDFAAAIAAGNPVIAKGHSSHPGTTRLFAEEASGAAAETDMPPALVQLVYRTDHSDGCRLVSDSRIGATGYTGARDTGLILKRAADRAGKPIYLELSSINPVIILPGALTERGDEIAEQFAASCLLGTGQFCTNPGLVLLLEDETTRRFVECVRDRFEQTAPGTFLSKGVQHHFGDSVKSLLEKGAHFVTGGHPVADGLCSHQNTLLEVDGDTFLANSAGLQTEMFGNGALFVIAANAEQAITIAEQFEGNLTGTIYSHTAGQDDALYDRMAPILRERVGRLLNDKMPTGVAVSPAMNHGGPFPATSQAVFTSVGIPASIHRFAMLQCYDNVRSHRLPALLQDVNPDGCAWRSIDMNWTKADVVAD